MAVDVDGVEAGDEVDKDIVDALGDLAEQRGGDDLVGGVLLEVDGDEKLLSLLVDIADIDTTLVGEENPVTLKRKISRGTKTGSTAAVGVQDGQN